MQEPIVTTRAVSYRYGSRLALDDVSISIAPGSLVALVGDNGSGKSTLLSILAGVVRPADGSVDHRTRHRPAVVFQRSEATDELPLTVRECVAIGRFGPHRVFRRLDATDRRIVRDLLERLEIDHLARRQLRELSGGQRQRALLAQGLAQQSDLLLLDEPTAALDVAGQATVDALLRETVAAGVTVVHATHRQGDAHRSDQTIVLTDGRVAAGSRPAATARTQ